MTDYNDGNWHGWNGGECPVHPLSLVEVRFVDGDRTHFRQTDTAGEHVWEWTDDYDDIVVFRVVKPYVEPETRTGECWAYPSGRNNPPVFFDDVSDVIGGTCAKGRFTETRIHGKPTRIVWEADE